MIGSRILSRAKPAASVIQAVEQHHERWDGLGFPYGLKGDGIQLYARIVAVANAYDHMMFSPGAVVTPDEALRRLERGAGLLWDPGLVAIFTGEVGRRPSAESEQNDGWLEEILTAT
ncbi:MAG: hypothetical protein DHS20C21_22260 [Gemmatimonadota bacterium]|nr:MAG: hypothetical protein DHS20C21_22260 [Gemmatimonadota bacterium]